jgi:hypothetical protein
LVIRQNHNRAPGFRSPCTADVLRSVQQRVGDPRSAVETLRSQDIMQLTDNLAVIAIERQPDFGPGIEDHDGHPILGGQNPQCLSGCIGDALHVRLHAPADIKQQQYVDRHVLAGEIANRLDFSVHSQDEVIDV